MPIVITKSIKATAGDYTTIVAWEAGEQGDLVVADQVRVGELYNETYAGIVTIDGSTTDATRYMEISVAAGNRHNGTSTGGGAVIDPTTTGHVFTVSDDFFHATWLRITDWIGDSSEAFRVNSTGLVVDKCIVHDTVPTGNPATDNQDGVYVGVDGITVNVRNSIFYNLQRAAVMIQIDTQTTAVLNIFNCTAYKCVSSNNTLTFGQFSARAGTINVRNCAAFDKVNSNMSDFGKHAAASWGTSSNNISSDTSATTTGLNSLNSKVATTQFVNVGAGIEDFHLKTGADAIDVGVDLSGTFPDDIDGVNRSGTWDMGADEFVAAGGPTGYPSAYYDNHLVGQPVGVM